jgi:hypothetical protein
VNAASVCRDHATDGGRASGTVIYPEGKARSLQVALQRLKGRACSHGYLPGPLIERSYFCKALQAYDDLASARHTASDKARISSLRDSRDAQVVEYRHNLCCLVCVGRSHNGLALCDKTPGPVALIARPQLRLRKDVVVSDHTAKLCDEFFTACLIH